MPAKSETEKVW